MGTGCGRQADDLIRAAHFAGGPWDGMLVGLGMEFAGPDGPCEFLSVELDRTRGVVHQYKLEGFSVSRVVGTTFEHLFYRHQGAHPKT